MTAALPAYHDPARPLPVPPAPVVRTQPSVWRIALGVFLGMTMFSVVAMILSFVLMFVFAAAFAATFEREIKDIQNTSSECPDGFSRGLGGICAPTQ